MIARHQALPAGLFATEIILCRLDHGTGLSLFCMYKPQRTGTSGGMGASLTRQRSTGKFCSR
jgi:hypothetical protein